MTDERRLVATLTLAATAVVTVVMAVWGYHALTAPIARDPVTAAAPGADCTPGTGSTDVVRRSDVTVSVYNAGRRAGWAQKTLDLLEKAGFRPGAIGNAPAGVAVARAQVRTTRQDDPAARLVARSLGRRTKVVVVTDDLGPGVDVVIGDKFRALDASAPDQVRVGSAGTTCS